MNLADAAQLKVTASNSPNDRVTLEIGATHITMPALDVAQMMIEHLLLSTARDTTSTIGTPAARPQKLSAALGLEPPRIGAAWPAEGGIYAGVVRGNAGEPDCYLIVADATCEAMNWKAAGEWAQSLWIEGFRDFTLPKRKEQAVLFGNVPELFDQAWYWSSEEHAGYPECAWFQIFLSGYQSITRKDYELRARAVRRVSIE